MLSHLLGMFADAYVAPEAVGDNVLVYYSGAQNVGSSPVALTFDTAAHDTLGAWASGAPERLTIPAALNGKRVRFLGGYYGTRGGTQTIRKNGADFIGAGGGSCSDQSSPDIGRFALSAPVLVATSDYFDTLSVGSHSSSTSIANMDFLALEVLPAGQRGAFVYKTATQSVSAATSTPITMDSEDYDDGGWHDTVTNPARITVPFGSSNLIRLSGCVSLPAGLSEAGLFILKNGSQAYGLPYLEYPGTRDISIMSALLDVSAGDYFELCVWANAGHTIAVNDRTWFAVEEITAGTRHALVRKTANQSLTAATNTILTWATEEADVGGWFDSATSTSRLVVPAGVTKVRVTGNAERVTEGNFLVGKIYKNGSQVIGGAVGAVATSGGEITHVVSAVLDVTAGDYFEFVCHAQQGNQIVAGTRTWFAIEEIPA